MFEGVPQPSADWGEERRSVARSSWKIQQQAIWVNGRIEGTWSRATGASRVQAAGVSSRVGGEDRGWVSGVCREQGPWSGAR